MNSSFKITLLGTAVAIFALPGFAQSTNTTTTAPVTAKTIQQRQENQQDRIAHGVNDGQLTAGEAAGIEKKEADMKQEERNMRTRNDGKLTTAEKEKLTRQQNQISHQISTDTHNGATQNLDPKSEVGKREENQQDRISQGINSGQVSAGEATHLENNENRINNEVRQDRAANGGTLTQQEKKQVNQQMNRQSKQIYRAKHNGRR